jgi:DNA polymerase-3 subunit delta
MKLDARTLASFVNAPDDKLRAVLLYGPDAGLVRERAKALAAAIVGDPPDPFRYTEASVERLRDTPTLLADEAAALSFTPGRRVVRLAGFAGPAILTVTKACETLLESDGREALVIVEAGEIDGRSALRKLFESAKDAGALACYHDEGDALETLIERTLAQNQVRAAPDALAWLVDHLGGDRGITRSELAKLALYAGPGATIELADAQAMVGDSAELDIDDLVHAVAGGDAPALERTWSRLIAEGANAVTILRAVQRYFLRLHLCAGLMTDGMDAKTAMGRLRPPVFWKDSARFERQLRRWSLAKLGPALTRLLEAEMQVKSGRMPQALVAQRCLLELAR